MSVGLAVEITIEDRSLKYEAYKCIASIDIIPTILGQRSLRCDCPAVLIHLEIFFGGPIK